MAFQALYAWDAADKKKAALNDLLDFSWVEKIPPAGQTEKSESFSPDFSRLLVLGAAENISSVDAMIQRHLVHWDFSRLNNVDKALLRMGVYELLFQTAPPSVIIDEAVEISKEYGTDDSYRFINGVLDGVRKTIQKEKGEAQ